jgi:hypothetical protein
MTNAFIHRICILQCTSCVFIPIALFVDPTIELVPNAVARERAHDGPVTALAAAAGRVWTAGGGAAFLCLREWTQRGEHIAKHDLRSVGAAACMVVATQLVCITVPSDLLASTLSLGTATSSTMQQAQQAEVPQSWQLLTGHGNGMVQVWGQVGGLLRPLLRIGEQSSPVTGIHISEALGALITAHLGEAGREEKKERNSEICTGSLAISLLHERTRLWGALISLLRNGCFDSHPTEEDLPNSLLFPMTRWKPPCEDCPSVVES